MLRSAFSACACGLAAIAALAQQPPPDPATVIGNLEKQIEPLASAWLHSSDPRLEAWGAYVVLRDRHTESIPDLLAMLAGFAVVEERGTQADVDQHDAMLGVLDAVIQFGAPVPAGDAQRIYPEFPVQSLILLSRSGEDATPALLGIFKDEHRFTAAWLAAGALLTERRADGFAAAVVETMTVHAQLTVTEPNTGGGMGGSASCCGASVLGKPKTGWPPVGIYGFAGCGSGLQPGIALLAGGTDPAYYTRQVNASYQPIGGGNCCNLDQDVVRQHYLTTLLYQSADQPPVRAHVSHTIVWQGLAAYHSELAAFIAEQQQVLTNLAQRLGAQNLVSEEDAKTLRPKLQISVWDQRASRDPALLAIAPLAENVTIEPL